jgi:hypothetical protein
MKIFVLLFDNGEGWAEDRSGCTIVVRALDKEAAIKDAQWEAREILGDRARVDSIVEIDSEGVGILFVCAH